MHKIRKILYPLGWFYGVAVWLRNKLFDWKILSSKSYQIPVISVGNLSVGGTGKSPMVEYLIELLQSDYRLATLSRGYKRKTKGFYRVMGNELAEETGDEPLQFKSKFPNVEVVVDEDRQHGIAEILKFDPVPEVILLDDAFQHRRVTPGYSILLTSYDALYVDDLMLPAGNLREPKWGAERADIIVVTKCPPELRLRIRESLERKLNLKPHQELFFSYIAYARYFTDGEKRLSLKQLPKDFCLVTGIAKPGPLVEYLRKRRFKFEHRSYPDHHNFSKVELETLKREKFILTTEKDFMRLKPHFTEGKLYYLPIKQDFVRGKMFFDGLVKGWVRHRVEKL